MRIRVKGFLTLRELIGEQEIEVESTTLRGLLEKLCLEFGDEFRDMIFDLETQSVGQYIAVLVNGRHYTHIPERLETELKDGDEVAIFPPVVGG